MSRGVVVAGSTFLTLALSLLPSSAAATCEVRWFAGGITWISPGMTAGSCHTTGADGAEWVDSTPRSAEWSFYPSPDCTGDPVALGNGFRRFSPPGQPLHFGSVKMDTCP
ncbi:hypothetical protein [Streptomyces sp. NPDC049555]|uniref:hypothetical protein n=1 Tax=Streptomyces sp. NPDC049555 TaxID=3154930 RepID=UPI00341B9C9E